MFNTWMGVLGKLCGNICLGMSSTWTVMTTGPYVLPIYSHSVSIVPADSVWELIGLILMQLPLRILHFLFVWLKTSFSSKNFDKFY